MKNELSLESPFPWMREISSIYVFKIDLENSVFLMESDLKVLNRTSWLESGLSANYSYVEGEEDDSQTHTVKLRVKTPLKFLKYVDTRTIYVVDGNVYKTRVSITTEDSRADLAGSVELGKSLIDASVSADVDSPALYIPRTKITAKRDFTDKEKHLLFAIHIAEPQDRSAEFRASWLVEDENYVKASMALETWLAPLRSIEADVLYVNAIPANNSVSLNLVFRHSPEQEYRLVGGYADGTVDLDIHSPAASHEHLHFHGNVDKARQGLYSVEGDLKNLKTSEIHRVGGSLAFPANDNFTVDITVSPSDETSKSSRVILRISREKYRLSVGVSNDDYDGALSLNYVNAVNWDTNLKVEDYKLAQKYEVNTFMNVQVNGNTTIYVQATTPWKEIETFSLDGNLLLSNVTGQVKLIHKLNEDTSHGLLSWRLVYLTDMFVRLASGINDRSVDARVFLTNPRRAFKNFDVGFDLDVDRERWKLAANATVGYKNQENVDAVVSVRLPPPDNDDHRLLLSYHANHGVQDARYVVGYNAVRAKTNYASDGSVKCLPLIIAVL